jgi:hypothetical protein
MGGFESADTLGPASSMAADARAVLKERRLGFYRELTSAAASWREPARYAGERFESAAERLTNALWPLRGRPCRDVRRQRGGTWPHFRSAALLCSSRAIVFLRPVLNGS